MAYGSTHPAAEPHPDTGVHIITWTLAALGTIAAAIGAVIALGPDDGTLRIFDQTWSYMDLQDAWAPALLIGGGIVASLSMATSVSRDAMRNRNGWMIATEYIVLAIGIAAVISGMILAF